MTSIPENKRIAIIGGGTNTYISNHLALSAPAYGSTAKKLANKFRANSENEMQVDLYLTKMAQQAPGNPDTPEEVEALVDKLIADPNTRVIVFNVAMIDFKPKLLKEIDFTFEPYNHVTEHESFGKYVRRFSTTKTELILHLSPYQKVIQKIRKERKDILLVGFKTTCGSTKEEQFHKGLKLCKDASANIVFVNDVDKHRIELLNNIENVIDRLLDRLQNHFCYTSNIFEDTILNNKIRITDEFNFKYSDNVKEYRKQLCALILTTFQNNGIITSEESSYWYDTRDEALDALVQMVLDRSHLHFTRSTVVNAETVPWNSEEIPNVLREVVDHCVAQGAYKTFTIGDSND